MQNDPLSYIPLIFHKPTQPLFLPRNEVVFDVPVELWDERYKSMYSPSSQVATTYGTPLLPTVKIQKFSGQPPDLSYVLNLDRTADFSVFNSHHQKYAVELIKIFMKPRSVDELTTVLVYARERVNPYLFLYAASVALSHRLDTKDMPLPNFSSLFPNLFIDTGSFTTARKEAAVLPANKRVPIEVPRDHTATDLDDEHKVAYWREDLGLSLHHWHWHLVYPFFGLPDIVKKDRRGELFYYMHEQIIARYNTERLCNRLNRVRRLNNLRAPVFEGYFPKVDNGITGQNFPPRFPNTFLKDVRREQDSHVVPKIEIASVERWRDCILNAIRHGFVFDGAKNIPLNDSDDIDKGIDTLGNMVEASDLSVNKMVYGDFHNSVHLLLAYIHDPDGRYKENAGLMANTSTTMRDPIFYVHHAFINDIFIEYKETLPSYTKAHLSFNKVSVTGVEVISENAPANTFLTFWQQSDVDIANGIEFPTNGAVYARLTHLQHAPFSFRIQVNNAGAKRKGTCRIFMAPHFDEGNYPIFFKDQRTLFIELDKFTVDLEPGSYTIERESSKSSVTIPYEQTFGNVSPPSNGSGEDFAYCGCGWPDHLLIPKGTTTGYSMDLFVMISDFTQDMVEQPKITDCKKCSEAHSYCGLRSSLYPDKRAMGYPFDRKGPEGVKTLKDFLTDNMFALEIKIQHENIVKSRV